MRQPEQLNDSTQSKALAKSQSETQGSAIQAVASSKNAGPEKGKGRGQAIPEPRGQHGRGQGELNMRSADKDPNGGLTAAGRRTYRNKEGANLKPGVKKKVADMSPAELKRKGSWAVRFFGRKKLPPLLDKDGKPTRFALTARAWGEAAPRTVEAARKIAAKGRRLLDRFRRTKAAKG